ncbi:MAG: methyltransferase domain-containing protein [Gammaproteobacteria bacterium]
MSLSRIIDPELLDTLAPDDPRALRARRDLRRVNLVMGQAAIWQRIMRNGFSPAHSPLVIVELGAGDGTLLLNLARTWAPCWPQVKVCLVDLHPAVTNRTLLAYAALGWRPVVVTADVTDWMITAPPADLILSNLFLHHFKNAQLAELLYRIAGKTAVFAACEPRRSGMALAGSRLLGLIGCGPVTRHDAVVSVRAGFRDNELTALWPATREWQVREGSAGLFTHTFMAQRIQ